MCPRPTRTSMTRHRAHSFTDVTGRFGSGESASVRRATQRRSLRAIVRFSLDAPIEPDRARSSPVRQTARRVDIDHRRCEVRRASVARTARAEREAPVPDRWIEVQTNHAGLRDSAPVRRLAVGSVPDGRPTDVERGLRAAPSSDRRTPRRDGETLGLATAGAHSMTSSTLAIAIAPCRGARDRPPGWSVPSSHPTTASWSPSRDQRFEPAASLSSSAVRSTSAPTSSSPVPAPDRSPDPIRAGRPAPRRNVDAPRWVSRSSGAWRRA